MAIVYWLSANSLDKNPEVKLNKLFRKLLQTRNRNKIKRIIEFIETLS